VHSHNEREITTNNIFPGGMLMMMLVDPRAYQIDDRSIGRTAMRAINSKASLMKSALAAAVLLVAATASYAQDRRRSDRVTHAGRAARRASGADVGILLRCRECPGGRLPAGKPDAGVNATTLVPNWSPVVVTVPYTEALGVSTTSLTINLTNNLSFTAGTGTNTLPTSLVIVGQIGGGLGGRTDENREPGGMVLKADLARRGWPGSQHCELHRQPRDRRRRRHELPAGPA